MRTGSNYLASYAFSTSIFIIACIWNKNSFPAAGSPFGTGQVLQRNVGTIQNSIQMLFFLLYHQIAQPTQNSTSGCFPWASISACGTIKFSDISYFFYSVSSLTFFLQVVNQFSTLKKLIFIFPI
jgi:hypothetical protein